MQPVDQEEVGAPTEYLVDRMLQTCGCSHVHMYANNKCSDEGMLQPHQTMIKGPCIGEVDRHAAVCSPTATRSPAAACKDAIGPQHFLESCWDFLSTKDEAETVV